MRTNLLTILLQLLFAISSLAQSNKISSTALQQDYEIMRTVLLKYHPGLYRFQDSLSLEKHFLTLKKELNSDRTLAEAYLAFSKFTASIQCGHTFCSYYNQPGAVRDSLFNREDKVPFTFFIYEKRMFIDKNLTDHDLLRQYTEILEIDGRPVEKIIDTLLKYVKGDGANNLKRLNDLNLTGLGKYEAWDVYYPLLFPAKQQTLKLKVRSIGKDEEDYVEVGTMSRAKRFSKMESKFGKQPATYDDLWKFEIKSNDIAYLKIGTFVTNKLSMNWKKFLDSCFNVIQSQNIQKLIIDVRGNEGGDDEVNLELGKHLAKQEIKFPEFTEKLRYEKVEEEHKKYLSTWDDSFYDRSGKLSRIDSRFYVYTKARKASSIPKSKNAYQGKTILLVDAANSSATFFLAKTMMQNKLATVIGTETGGNLKGTNGGQLFFFRLPNSKIEIDLPLIGYYPTGEQANRGITPNIVVNPSLLDLLTGKDPVLEKAVGELTN